MTKKNVENMGKVTAKIYMPDMKTLKVPPGMEDYFSLDCHKLPGIIKATSFTIGIVYDLNDVEPEDWPEAIKSLPGRPVEEDEKIDYTPGVIFSDEVDEWMKTQPTGKVFVSPGQVMFFEKEEDLSWFLLRFGEGIKK